MSSFVFPMVLSQKVTMSFISLNENSFSFENQLLRNSWSWFPMVGSSSSFNPLRTNFSEMKRVKNSLCDSYLACFSLSLLSFNATPSLLMFWGKITWEVGVWVKLAGAVWEVFRRLISEVFTSVDVHTCSIKHLDWLHRVFVLSSVRHFLLHSSLFCWRM